MSKGLLKNNAMADVLGMTPQAFCKAVKQGRFSIDSQDRNGKNLFDPDVVVAEFESTNAVASVQDRAKVMPDGLRGGRPKNTNNGMGGAGNLTCDGGMGGSGGNMGGNMGGYQSSDYLRIKTEKEAIQADLLALKLEIQEGKLIESDKVYRDASELGAVLVANLLTMPARLAPLLSDKDEHDCRLLLETEINDMIMTIRDKCGVGDE